MPFYSIVRCPWHDEQTASCLITWDAGDAWLDPAPAVVTCLGCGHDSDLDEFNAQVKTLSPDRQEEYENAFLAAAENHFEQGG